MKIFVWTTNPAKLNAIREWIEKCNYFKNKNEVEIIWEKISSWVSDMPLSLEENILWAKNRAENLKKAWFDWDFFIWMEWWTTKIWDKAYLFWALYILDKNWKWHLWISNLMEVPKSFEKAIYEDWEELWVVLWKATWDSEASKKWWAFWAWSDMNLTRSDQFVFAFLSAIPPFFNKYYEN